MTPLHATHGPPVRTPSKRRGTTRPRAHAPATFFEKPTLHELRSDETAESNGWLVSHAGSDVDIELRHAGIPILSGRLEGRLLIAGHEVGSRNPWQNICSEVNEEAAYIELQRDMDGGIQIDRQIFLARRDEFAYMADVVRGARDSVGEYRWRIPLAPQTQWFPAAESHEGHIRSGRRNVASVIPLSLPEWRSEPGRQLDASANQLLLNLPFRHRTHAALFLDLAPRRFRRPLTWRRLTVGESLAAVPRDVAAGYRVQIGKSQWLIYRSLGPIANRSVLGQNLRTDFVVARFLSNGTIERLLEIE